MKTRISFFVTLIVLFIVNNVFAQIGTSLTKTGTTAAQFLKIGIGSRALGRGGAFVSSANDVSSFYWNPSGLAKIYTREFSFNHIDWFLDIKFDNAAFAMNVGRLGTIGSFVSVLTMDEMLVRTVERPEGTGEYFKAGGMIIGISYARNLTENFAIGFNVKYINEYIWNESATGFALDIGTLYSIPFLNETRIGASISNFGTKMRLSGRDLLVLTGTGPGGANIINTEHQTDYFDLPLLFRVGIAIDILKTEFSKLTLETDAVHPNDNTEYLNSGMEYSWNDKIFIRVGYKSLFERDTEQGLTLGFGLNYRLVDLVTLKFDYAYQDFGRLQNIHYLSLGIVF